MSGTPCSALTSLGEPLDGVGIGDVKGVGVRDPTAGGDLRGGLLDRGLVDVADHHFGALAGERQRGLAADAAARAGHGNQCVAEVFARTTDLRAQQSPARRLALEVVDELVHRLRDHVGACDIGDQWPALMSRRHSRGTQFLMSSYTYGRTNGSLVLTMTCTGTST